ncbi:MAG: Ig-like domain-containing protein [Bacteroidia bacterium]|nr:Ig-like domain-containing protein [Bacteroidia bacterium]
MKKINILTLFGIIILSVLGTGKLNAQICATPPVGCASTDLSNYGINSNTDAATIEYDNAVAGFHTTMIRNGDGSVSIWGQNAQNNGSSHALTARQINKTNYPALTGTVLKFGIGSYASGTDATQMILLTTDGLFAWGEQGVVLNSSITTSRTFAKLDSAKFSANGANKFALPIGVTPGDVKMLFVTSGTIAITTCSGSVWVLSQRGQLRGNNNTGNGTTWYKVKKDASNDLTNIVACRGSYNVLYALDDTSGIWTWGINSYLGNGTGRSNRSYATAMSRPMAGYPIKMIGSTTDNKNNRTSYYVLGKDSTLFALGYNNSRQLGDWSETERTSWVRCQYSNTAADSMTNIVWISPNEHDRGDANSNSTAAINVLNSNKEVWAFGSSDSWMIGLGNGASNNPGRPAGINGSTDSMLTVETGGHISLVIKQCEVNFGYVGHKTHGSMADSVDASSYLSTYTFSTTAVNICGAPGEPQIEVYPIVGALVATAASFCYGSDYIMRLSDTSGVTVSFSVKSGPTKGFVSISGDTLRFTEPASVEITASIYNVCHPVTPIDTTFTVTMEQCKFTSPDVNMGNVYASITGNVSTNDVVAHGKIHYENYYSNTLKPVGSNPSLTVYADGSYTFITDLPGTYMYDVSVCDSGQFASCLTETLTIYVKDPSTLNNPPMPSTDIAVTAFNTAVTLKTVSNDKAGSPNKSIDPTSVTIVSGTAPNPTTEGTLSVNPSTGDITFFPATGFVGDVYYQYEVCDNGSPAQFAKAIQKISVFGSGRDNTTLGVDDFNKGQMNENQTGNLLNNDIDPESDNQSVTAAVTTKPGVGKLTVSSNGNYTFEPAFGFYGSTNFVYEVCDDNATPVCANATLYLLVEKEETEQDFHATTVNVEVSGDVSTNDNLPLGYSYTNISSVLGNPSADKPVLSSDGSYTFKPSKAGIYQFEVEACTPSPSIICVTELLTITVVDVTKINNLPATTPDFALMYGHPTTPATITIDVVSNDNPANVGGGLNTLGNPTINAGSVKNGATINVSSGRVNYTPAAGFYGNDTFTYNVCEQPAGVNCRDEVVIVTVLEPGTPPHIIASDNYAITNSTTPVSRTAANGILPNDYSSTGGTKTASLIGSASIVGVGSLSLSSDGSYTFTPNASFIGTVAYPYQVCDGALCTNATLYIQVYSPALLPITLIDLSARLTPARTSIVEWITAQEENNQFFTVHKSTDGSRWEVLSIVPSQGNSVQIQSYSTIDANPKVGVNYYRLTQTDIDGTETNLGTRMVMVSESNDKLIEPVVYPNPSKGKLFIDVKGSSFTFTIFNMQGKQIMSSNATNSTVIENLSTGLYFIRLEYGNQVETMKVVVE